MEYVLIVQGVCIVAQICCAIYMTSAMRDTHLMLKLLGNRSDGR